VITDNVSVSLKKTILMQSLRPEVCGENQKAQHARCVQRVATTRPALAAGGRPTDISPQQWLPTRGLAPENTS